jgi:hypothetical protein
MATATAVEEESKEWNVGMLVRGFREECGAGVVLNSETAQARKTGAMV